MTIEKKETAMNRKIYLIGGGKGGVGKSIVTLATVQRLLEGGAQVIVVDSDTENPDVLKCYVNPVDGSLIEVGDVRGRVVAARACNLEAGNGWVELLNLCDEYPEATVVVNTRAANSEGLQEYGDTLRGCLKELGRSLIVLWVINPQKDSVQLLKRFRTVMPEAEVHVVRNEVFCKETEFVLYNTSDLKTDIEAGGGRSLTIPRLASLVANQIYSTRLNIGHAFKKLPIGERAELRRWKNLVDIALAQVVA
jgi:CO dehydrogenase nickel-insertion accessory protein CooC1